MSRLRDLALCAAVLLLGACGGGGGGTPGSALALSSVAPASGTSLGGTTLTLEGRDFTSDVVVRVGTSAASSVVIVSPTQLTCRTPSGPAGQAVAVTATRGSETSSLPDAFTYHPLPEITGIEPDAGFQAGGLDVEITGRGFTDFGAGTNQVYFGASPVTVLSVVDDTRVRVQTPSTSSGLLDVRLNNANGEAGVTAGFAAFRYPLHFRTPRTRLGVDGANALAYGPRLASDGRHLYAAWTDARNGTWAPAPYVNGSHDHGTTWMANDVSATSLEGSGLVVALPQGPEICCSGESLYVVWLDQRNGGSTQRDAYFNRSLDGGATWLEADVWLDDADIHVDDRAICCEGATVHVVWSGEDAPHAGFYYQRSSDGGETWLSAPIRLDDAYATAAAGAGCIACDGDRVAVVWYESRDGGPPRVFARSSPDGGVTWPLASQALGTPGIWAAWPRVTVEGETVHVAWKQAGSAQGTAYVRSTDGGVTWPSVPTLFDAGKGGLPRLCSDGQHVYVVWLSFQYQGDGTSLLLLNASSDGGATWRGETRLNADTLTSESGTTELCCEQDHVFVVWGGEHDGRDDVYFTSSLDAGATWLPTPLRMDADVDFGQTTWPPKVYCACVGPRVHVVWGAAGTEIDIASSEP